MSYTPKTSLLLAIVFAATGACHVASPTSADVVFNNFGPGDTYGSTDAYGLSGPQSFFGEIDAAMSFTPTGGDFLFDRADIAFLGLNQPNGVDILLAQDSGLNTPGDILETISLQDILTDPPMFTTVLTANSKRHSLLTAGHQYWLIANGVGDNFSGWVSSDTDSIGLGAYRENLGDWQTATETLRAFRIIGTAVPEPGALSLLVGASVCWQVLIVRRRRGCR